MHNSAVCENKSKQGKAKSEVSDSDIKNVTGETSTNYSSNLASILLQTAEIVLENPFNKKEVRVKDFWIKVLGVVICPKELKVF